MTALAKLPGRGTALVKAFEEEREAKDRELLEKADKLKEQVFSLYVELSEVLYQIRERASYRLMGLATFREYCEQRLGFRERKGEYLVSIHRNLVLEAGIPKDELKKVDWSAAREVASLPQDELMKRGESWLKKAKEMSVRELALEVRDAKGRRDPERVFPLHFLLYEQQHKNVMAALKLAEKIAGSNKKSHLLDLIALEFNAARLEESGATLEWLLTQVNRVFNVECVAVKVTGKKEEIVFGKEFAKKLGVE